VREFQDDDDYVPGRNKELVQKLGQKLPRTASELAKEAADPRRNKKGPSRQGGQGRDGRGADARQLQLQQLSMRRAPPQPNMPPSWSQDDDSLLCAITNEFGQNWSLVSDVLSSTCAMQGVHRKPEWCRARYQMLSKPEGGGPRRPAPATASACACAAHVPELARAARGRAARAVWRAGALPGQWLGPERGRSAPQAGRTTASRGSSPPLRR
jgi:hypothetical protein